MTIEECTAALTPLALALRAEMDVPTFSAYHRVLRDVPVSLLEMAVDAVLRTPIEFMPSAPKLLAGCEQSRRQWLAANPHKGCKECQGQRGFRNVITQGGQRMVERCPCLGVHQAQLAHAGMLTALASLPGEEPIDLPVDPPRIAQLPDGLRSKVQSIVDRKAMR